MYFARFTLAITAVAALGACTASQDANIISTADAETAQGEAVKTPGVAPPPPMPTGSDQAVATSTLRMATVMNGAQVPAASTAANPAVADAASYRYFPPVFVPVRPDREQYAGEEVSPVHLVGSEPVSTFSVDVDTAAYANARRFLTNGMLPPQDAVRTEEFINYFNYDYDRPATSTQPFAVDFDVAESPWNPDTRLVRVALTGYDIARSERPAANLVFLIDVSGSMKRPDKLPLVKAALRGLTERLGAKDTVSIVVYAGAAGLVLEPTSDTDVIRSAIERLEAGGSTAGGAGIKLAYRIAEDNLIEGGINRVVLATDGDFNVGVTDRDALIDLIEKERESGVTLTALGFGTGNINDAMMEQVADHGNGNYAYIDSALEARRVLGEELSGTLFTIAKDVKIQVEFNPAVVSQYRLIGYENRALREEDFDNDLVDAGDIGAGHQVTALYEVVPAGGDGWISPRRYQTKPDKNAIALAGEAAHIKLRYKLPGEVTSRLIERTLPASALHSAVKPRGDFAFAAAVAAFGQKLRGDKLLGDFSYDRIVDLAGSQSNFWRQQFVELVEIAAGLG